VTSSDGQRAVLDIDGLDNHADIGMITEMVSRPGQDHVTVREAAVMLGVSQRDVIRLIAEKRLPAARVGHEWWIARSAVEERLALAPRAGRRLSPVNAWAILFLASGDPVPWLSSQARWLARARLVDGTVWDIRDRLSTRAETGLWRAHPSLLVRLRDDPAVMLTGLSAAGTLRLGLIGPDDHVDAYIDRHRVDAFVARHHLRPSSQPNVTLRVVPGDAWAWPLRPVAPVAAVGLDLALEAEPRARAAGERLLASLG
jgi:excisionase family DNA binding protein